MKAVFADTFYFLALLNQRDACHRRAIEVSRTQGLSITTTEFVLLELCDALNKPRVRSEAAAVWRLVESDPTFRLVRVLPDLLHRGFVLYENRDDKEWPLTDCISFVVMKDEGLVHALTGDRHFEQAGFKAVLA
jgi:predicted nucleic acid-binding protein